MRRRRSAGFTNLPILLTETCSGAADRARLREFVHFLVSQTEQLPQRAPRVLAQPRWRCELRHWRLSELKRRPDQGKRFVAVIDVVYEVALGYLG